MNVSIRKKKLVLAAALGAALLVGGCGNLSHDVAADGSGAKELVWPKAVDTNAIHKGGTFPNVTNLREVQPGLTRNQVMALIGEPHFGEGTGNVREWNYLFNFRSADGQVRQCEYKVLFDKDAIARSFYWNPASCADALKAAPEGAS